MSKTKRLKAVPTVRPEHLIEAYKKVLADREQFGSTDVFVSVASLYAKVLEPKDTFHLINRIFALANFIAAGHAKKWLQEETGGEYVLMHESLLRAAARAPLIETEYLKDISFCEETFMPLVLEDSTPEGQG